MLLTRGGLVVVVVGGDGGGVVVAMGRLGAGYYHVRGASQTGAVPSAYSQLTGRQR